ncbi:Kelch motif protein [Dysgonomonas alginatilytica]|uniref:Kelch motif protein n=1 Tax=Dysgonomonas alginatilytica TaxID=1605892 RepID=A0A2V3PVW6_9BACT|nr:kelch repeat-containing protein [Dysgonomonas alginatilytica]PXV68971.1 Kelch motif protein [Dysgonomonas alginatilytica]
MKIYLCVLFIMSLAFTGCDKKEYIYEEFEKPTIEILSTDIESKDVCEIELKINIGVGVTIKNAYLKVWDVTSDSTQSEDYKIELTQDREQIHKVIVKALKDKHDYKIRAILRSDNNEYVSSPKIIRFSDILIQNGINYINLYLGDNERDYFYVDEINKIGKNLKKGELFLFNIYYSKLPSQNTKTEIKLNGNIPIRTSIEYSGWMEDGEVSGIGYLPEDIVPGIYTIHVYMDEVEYILEYKIRILPGSSERFYIDPRPDKESYIGDITNYFVTDNKAYYIHNLIAPYTVLSFDLNTLKWKKMRDIPLNYSDQYFNIQPQRISSNNNHYFLFRMSTKGSYDYDSMTLWEYIEVNDSWSRITTYPGLGESGYIAFIVGDNIYMGGGVKNVYNEYGAFISQKSVTDFWIYNIKNKTWKRLGNVPYDSTGYDIYVNSTCVNGHDVFTFTHFRDLWKYNSQNDQWSKLETLRGGPYDRISSNLLYYKNKLYLVGGRTSKDNIGLRDVWEYDLNSNVWSLVDIQENVFGTTWGLDIPSFFFNDILYIGYGALMYDDKEFFYKVKTK